MATTEEDDAGEKYMCTQCGKVSTSKEIAEFNESFYLGVICPRCKKWSAIRDFIGIESNYRDLLDNVYRQQRGYE